LARSLEPVACALAKLAVAHPSVLDDHLEDALTAKGFGEPALAPLIQELISLRLEDEHLDTARVARHLALSGFSALLTDIDRAAAASGAPFLKEDVSLEAAKSQWSKGFVGLSRLSALDEAIRSAKGDLRGRDDMEAFERLKGERDALKRAIRTGTIWTGDES
jgi:DNA primase